ncbi:hypothetical protein OD785_31775 [Pseudomonas aeruginosa]|nr:hypothetical protein [Pseudomonas aeruginosa]MCV4078803.1 hypothetical protein [Pseudomonas aeruginosa]MCV4184645.1 hypothetical protein [Pseudomonas aeruginosa]
MPDAISNLLEPYSNAPVECDGFTRIAHSVLTGAGIPHSCMHGQLVSTSGDEELPIHFWIELDDGRVIDYRARMWLGDSEGVPHGVFKTDEYPDWHYLGTEITLPVFSPTMIQLLLWEPSV